MFKWIPVVVLETNQDGTVFQRVIKEFMIQGGDPSATGRGGESFWDGTRTID